ncbi:DUF1902 domain-containing protein [Pseudazoarcus pumilus]|uniref:DUF1902 domain-containing protein n=1 Tax=Pseudazoarcus pumilus TaxID=2067960 RepID=A0A2I6S3N4_9RHOO|nr:DUF1902 domain-containing protein [Pseudazoarcus pumilus]AUN93876.1 hypothetical protein C0099_02315 [Pseudazoarcus pumilus]
MHSIRVQAEWDEEAGVWYVADSSLDGLVTEAPTTEALMQKIAARACDLLGAEAVGNDVSVELTARRSSVVHVAA